MTPDYDRAATMAMQTLIENQVTETPIDPLALLTSRPNVRVISFARMANEAAMERDELIPIFVANQDAATFRLGMEIADVEYVVVYNARLPYEIICRGIARELGHIVLGHDGMTRTKEVRRAEAMCFAHHLLSPRPIFKIIQDAGMPLRAAEDFRVGCILRRAPCLSPPFTACNVILRDCGRPVSHHP